MSAVGQLLPFALLGLAGSLHCVGMCGPFALSLRWSHADARGAWSAVALYVVGKALSYVLLAVAVMGSAVVIAGRSGSSAPLADARAVLAWAAGASMVLVALQSLGLRLWPRSLAFGPLQRALAFTLRSVRALPRPAASLGLGLANGFLPCGLSWSAIALAAASPPWLAVTGALLFGLSTGPALGALVLGGSALPLAWRVRGQRVAALALLGFGAWTIARGGLPLGLEREVLPDCCTESPASQP